MLQYDLLGDRQLLLKVGQFKVPFGRQELTSSGSLQFVDRSIVSGEFARGRDVGVPPRQARARGPLRDLGSLRPHGLKLQGDFRRLADDAGDTHDNELRIQAQWIF